MNDDGYTKAKGDFGERARLAQLKAKHPKPFDFNKLERYANARNAPHFDLTTKEGFESVKATGNVNSALNHLLNMQTPYAEATSRQRGVATKFAKAIADDKARAAIQKDKAWPAALANNANAEQIREYAREHGVLTVPKDTAEKMLEKLPEAIKQNPELWGVDSNAKSFDDDVLKRFGELAVRIRDFGKTSDECHEHGVAAAEAATAADAAGSTKSIHDSAMPQPESVIPPGGEAEAPPGPAPSLPPSQPSPAMPVTFGSPMQNR
jgi:hypothetical protein